MEYKHTRLNDRRRHPDDRVESPLSPPRPQNLREGAEGTYGNHAMQGVRYCARRSILSETEAANGKGARNNNLTLISILTPSNHRQRFPSLPLSSPLLFFLLSLLSPLSSFSSLLSLFSIMPLYSLSWPENSRRNVLACAVLSSNVIDTTAAIGAHCKVCTHLLNKAMHEHAQAFSQGAS